MNDKFVIRTFETDDLEQVLDLHRVAMEDAGAYKGDGAWDDDLKDITSHYEKKGGLFLVGETEKSIISMGGFLRIDDSIAEVKRMRTYPEHQGNGYGKMILDELIKKAKEYGYRTLILETSDKQAAAMKLYRSAGFREERNEIIDGFNCTWFRLML